MNINKLFEGQREEVKKILFETDMSEGETRLTEKLILQVLNDTFVKFLDIEIERLYKKLNSDFYINIEDQIGYLRDIKRQLTEK